MARVIVEFGDEPRPAASPVHTRDAELVLLLRTDGTYTVWKDSNGGIATFPGAVVDTAQPFDN